MRASTAAFTLALVACRTEAPPPNAAPDEAPPGLASFTADQVQEDASLLLEVMEAVHPGYDRYANPEHPEFLAERDAAAATLRGMGDANLFELYRAVSRYAASIRCGHTKTEYPEAFSEWRMSNPSHLPLRFVTDGERMLIRTAAVVSGVTPGDEVLAIEGRSIPALMNELGPLLSVDGFTDFTRPFLLADDRDLMGAGLDHYLPVLFGVRSRVELRVRRLGGGEATVKVPLVTFEEWKSLDPGAHARDFSSSVHLDFPMAGVAVLRVDTFVNDRNPVDPAAIYRSALAHLSARGVTTLIVDLRRNDGGSDDAAIELLRALATEPFTFMKPHRMKTLSLQRFTPHLSSRDPTALEPNPEHYRALANGFYEHIPAPDNLTTSRLRPAKNAFRGDVILLTSPANASGVTHVAAKLVDLKRALVVGEPTGGSARGASAGALSFLTLPQSGIVVRIPASRQSVALDTDFEEGRGVMPHRLVSPTLEEQLDSRDPVFELALAMALGAAPPPRRSP